MKTLQSFLCFLSVALTFQRSQAADLFGIDNGSGALYRVSTANASVALVGNTGLSGFGALEFAPDGRLFAFTSTSGGGLFQINPNTAARTFIGPLNIGFVFEGGLAFAPNGTAYGVNQGSSDAAALFTINLTTGQATIVGTISGGGHDIDGLGWRSDGKLIGLDRVSNSLLTIDPLTAASAVLAPLNPIVGALGGMTIVGDQGYFSTAGPGASIPGSNELYAFNALTGSYSLIGSFSPPITGTGIGGLAMAVPEPSTAVMGGLAILVSATFRRRRE